jgi:aspartate-semialdehyde dehydrogenase
MKKTGNRKINLAILGATGAVGREMLKIIHELELPYNELRLLASNRSAGIKLECSGRKFIVEEVKESSFFGIDICLASAGSEVSKRWAAIAGENNVTFIDNSSAFRLDDNVPLVVPEVNSAKLYHHKKLIGNPNCSTIQLVHVLSALHLAFGLQKVIVSTYQSVSGAGYKGIDELNEQNKSLAEGSLPIVKHFSQQIAGNIIPQIDTFLPNGYTGEEMKIVLETRKILEAENLKITATAARVPVLYGHSEAVVLEFSHNITPQIVREVLSEVPNITVIDNTDQSLYPTSLDIIDNDNTLVGRIRQDLLGENWISLWIVSNNLRKGAALNAVQIAEYLIRKDLL